jgi:hypothetical protein
VVSFQRVKAGDGAMGRRLQGADPTKTPADVIETKYVRLQSG